MAMKMAAALALAALLAAPAPATARVVKEFRGGVQYFSDQAWDDELDDGVLATFPFDCEDAPDTCHYMIRLVFVPGNPDTDTCTNDPLTRWDECETLDQCVVSVEFGEPVLPVTDWHGRLSPVTVIATNQIAMAARDDLQPGRDTSPLWRGNDEFHGSDFSTLHILAGEVDLSDGHCRVGVVARYHPNSKTLFERGYLLPR